MRPEVKSLELQVDDLQFSVRHSTRRRTMQITVERSGDERHLPDWGREFDAVLSELTESPDDLTQATGRLRSIIASLSDGRAWLAALDS
jgi:hypothetical protein